MVGGRSLASVNRTALTRLARDGEDAATTLLLDGGLATTLADRGHDLSGALWSARLLVEDPEAIIAVHAAFLAAGAEVLTCASYQLAASSLAAAGLDPRDCDRLLARSVELARHAAARDAEDAGPAALVAASVGPYGAVLGGGAEYRGEYEIDRDALRSFHGPRIDALVEAGPDLIACETIPSGDEVAALTGLLAGRGVAAWVSMTVGPDGTTTPEGRPLVDALAPAAELDEVVAIGVNCCPPELAGPALETLGGMGVPLVVYPNIGARWDSAAGRWLREDVEVPDPTPWVEAGARLIGGCCGTGPEDLARLQQALDDQRASDNRSPGTSPSY